MNLRNGMARLTIVGVVLVELALAGGVYHAWAELNQAEQDVAELPVPPPPESDQTLDELSDQAAFTSPEDIVRSAAADSARREYEYAADAVETKKGDLYLVLGFLVGFPVAIAIVFQALLWIGRGFRSQPG